MLRRDFALIFAFSALTASAFGREPAPSPTPSPSWRPPDHAVPIDSRANEPARVFGLRIPFKIAPLKTSDEVSLDTHLGNAWNPTVAIDYGTGNRPLYIDEPDRYKVYTADGVIRSGRLRFKHRTSATSELDFALNFFMLAGGGASIDGPGSDRFIEWSHENIIGQHDPFQRKQNLWNDAKMQFRDRQGRNYDVEDGEIFFGTLDIGKTKYVDLIKNDRVLLTLNLGATVGIPLNSFQSHIAAGASAGAALTRRIDGKRSVTIASDINGQNNRALRLRSDKIDFADRVWASGYHFMLAYNRDYKRGDRFTFAIELQGMSSPLKKDAKNSVKGEFVGLDDPYYSAPKDEELNPITNEERSGGALMRGSEYIGLNFSYRFGKNPNGPTIGVYAQEDWKVFTGSRFAPLFEESDNAQDFGTGFKFTAPVSIRWKKR